MAKDRKKERADDQTVDAFSAPRSFIQAAKAEAKRRRMTKSGFYRYCLAKEMGWTDDEAMQITEHAMVSRLTVTDGIRQSGDGNVASINFHPPHEQKSDPRDTAKGKRKPRGTK